MIESGWKHMLGTETGTEQGRSRRSASVGGSNVTMVKRLVAVVAAVFIGLLGTSPVHAQTSPTPEECAESDTAPPGCPAEGDNYPVVVPDTGTVPEPTTTPAPPVELPDTGSSGSSGILQIGAILVASGLIVFVAARRRTAAPAA